MRLLSKTPLFARMTPSCRCAVFYAACSAVTRGSSEIEPDDLLLGLIALPHADDCGFRHLYEQREKIAEVLGLPSVTTETVQRFRQLQRHLPLSKESGKVLRAATREARHAKQFWVDTDFFQIALAVCSPNHDKLLTEAGYPLGTTRTLGEQGRLRHPPKQPTWMERARTKSTVFWFVAVATLALLLANLFNLVLAR